MNPDFKELSLFTEQKNFVEYQGDLYYVGTDLDILEDQGFEVEDGTIEISDYICSRRNIGCEPIKSQPYVEGYDVQDKDSHKYDGVRVLRENSGVLPDSDYLILRRLIHPPMGEIPHHVIYHLETERYYCMSNNCTTCNVEPHKIKSEYQVVSADIAAQEPMASTLVTREPKWASVFELKNLRMDPSLLQYMDTIMESHLRIPKRDVEYVQWLHDTFFYNQTPIYKLNRLVNECKLDNNVRPDLEAHITTLIDSFNTYRKPKDEPAV